MSSKIGIGLHRPVDIAAIDQAADGDGAGIDAHRLQRGVQGDRVVAQCGGRERQSAEGWHRHHAAQLACEEQCAGATFGEFGNQQRSELDGGHHTPQRFFGACAIERGDVSEQRAEVDRLTEAALADPDPWSGFAGFMDGLFVIQARNRSMNEAIARTPVGQVDVGAECGRAGGVLESVVNRARKAGVLRQDFGADDLATMIGAMSKVIVMSDGDDTVWRRHLGFVLDGLRAR
ncbi:MAG: hypothetical protein QOD36_2702 [Mycobacterium sp.]|jgi:hypothetical protein|nr:hypothetical protein [Mycobacterium sp.]MDT5245326.1 hypothetical protein [Mycobacterium sp.]